ncbi:ABC transporter permease [Anaerosacchariphilus polymeriproducens]|uniref:ABC transporter permease n=1 Tax=Anaerosacchariphilus polymeriproducens TaxID=1812858 RepID=A0A371ASL0_9FIRM|nr:ABC transporter permease [Anaerosacchariphilus polymeriproducens]RDU22558.1 ABC transporter permease [Anaerosacchariphilus polymeriproducens]
MKLMEFIKKYGIYVVLLLLVIFFSVSTDSFLVSSNLFNVARQVSMLGIASVGMAFVLLLGGIDLSIGSQITVVNIVAAWMMVKEGMNPVMSCFIAIAISVFVGFLNGWIIANINMPPLIVTLSSMTILEGIAYIISGGIPIFGFPKSFAVIGQGYIGPVPIPVVIMIIILGIGSFILNKTYFGRYFYAVGGNEEAAKLSGIHVKRVKYLVYTLSGLFAGIAGVVMLSRTNSGQALAGKGFEFDVLTAVVLGGVSVNGGSGKMSNVVAGVLILGVLSNGMVLLNVSQYVQMVTKGLVLLVAVGFDCWQKYKSVKVAKTA